MNITISRALIYQKMIRERLNDLKKLRETVAVKKTSYFGERNNEISEPMYDAKELDVKILGLQRMIFDLDSAVKEINSITTILVDIDLDELFKGIS